MEFMEFSPADVLSARRELARRHLVDFVAYTTPRWEPGPIHHEICRQLDRVVAGEVDRLMLLCPPQHGKSSITSKRAPAYMIGRNPTLDIISASATALLAEEFGGEVRNCIRDPAYQEIFPGVNLMADSQAKGRWKTTGGGGYYAVGMGGALFGRGASLGIIDDPFANWEDAQSELSRKKVWSWYQGTFYNRIRPDGAIIVIQHRMHEDDLVGRLLVEQKKGGDKWEVIELPALIDNPPWPQRYNRDALLRIKSNTSAMQWSALYMQDPTPDDGVFFKKEWFRRFRLGSEPKHLHKYISSDHAPAGNEDSDFTCVRVWGVDHLGDIYLLDGFRTQETMDKTMTKIVGSKLDGIKGLLAKHKPFCWFPEDDNNWKSVEGFVAKMMREERSYCRIEPQSPHGSNKETKAQPFQGMASSGRIWIPEGTEGDDIISQYIKFPAGKNDDEVDAAAVLCRAVDQLVAGVLPPADKPKIHDRYKFDEEETENWKTT